MIRVGARVRVLRLFLALFVLFFIWPYSVLGSSSASYQINESFLGPTGLLQGTSGSYDLRSGTGGDIGIGGSSSLTYDQAAGFNTTSEPRLAFAVNTSSVNLGSLSTSLAATATGSFSVLNYTSYGYIVQIIGSTPTNGSHNLSAMSGSGSSPGSEQFGINLVNNATPDVGADPVQVPSGTFAFGSAASNYNTADNFRYSSGATIAQATETSGETDFTISFLTNISTITPNGNYQGTLTLVCIGTY